MGSEANKIAAVINYYKTMNCFNSAQMQMTALIQSHEDWSYKNNIKKII